MIVLGNILNDDHGHAGLLPSGSTLCGKAQTRGIWVGGKFNVEAAVQTLHACEQPCPTCCDLLEDLRDPVTRLGEVAP